MLTVVMTVLSTGLGSIACDRGYNHLSDAIFRRAMDIFQQRHRVSRSAKGVRPVVLYVSYDRWFACSGLDGSLPAPQRRQW